MFGRAYAGEIKKLIRPRGLVVIGVLFLIFFILFASVYNMDLEALLSQMNDFFDEQGGAVSPDYVDENGNPITEEEYAEKYGYFNMNYFSLANENNIDKIISEISYYKSYFEDKAKTEEDYSQNVHYLEGSLVMLNYMRDNGVYDKDIAIDGYTNYLKLNTAESFAAAYFAIVIMILTIYGIVLGAGLYADEYRSGTIKLVMLRPVTRGALTTAKLFALFTYILSIAGVLTLLAYLYGLISLKSISLKEVFIVFNNASVMQTTVGGKVFLEMFLSAVAMLSLVSLSFMIGTVTRKKTLSIIVTLLIYMGLFSSILNSFNLERFLFSTNIDLTMYFGLSYNVPVGGNFFIALPVLLAYLTVIFTALYLTVKKRDIV